MGTRGFVGVVRGELKEGEPLPKSLDLVAGYNHSDSYPAYLGRAVAFLYNAGIIREEDFTQLIRNSGDFRVFLTEGKCPFCAKRGKVPCDFRNPDMYFAVYGKLHQLLFSPRDLQEFVKNLLKSPPDKEVRWHRHISAKEALITSTSYPADLEWGYLKLITDLIEKVGISYRRAWQLFKEGKLPNAYRLPSGTIVVVEEERKPLQVEEKVVAIYCRVSSSENRDNLERICNGKGL